MGESFAAWSLNREGLAKGSFLYGMTLISSPVSTRNFNLFFAIPQVE